MTDIIERLKSSTGTECADSELMQEALQEITELRKRRDDLEEILIMLVRISPPWDEDGKPTDAFPAFQERYRKLMHEAAALTGLDIRSTITRTEPRT